MTAFFVATASVKNSEKFQDYARRAAETLAAYEGEMVLRGPLDDVLLGSADHQTVGIVRFPSKDALSGWYNSDAYQALVPLREEAAEMTIAAYTLPA